MKKFDRDFWHHLILGLILLAGVLVFYLVSYSRLKQFVTGLVFSLLYVAWGAVHHYLDRDLHFKNMIEYIFIALLAVVILGGLLL